MRRPHGWRMSSSIFTPGSLNILGLVAPLISLHMMFLWYSTLLSSNYIQIVGSLSEDLRPYIGVTISRRRLRSSFSFHEMKGVVWGISFC